jgi:hypothetical protein
MVVFVRNNEVPHRPTTDLVALNALVITCFIRAADFTGRKEADVKNVFEPTLFAKLVNSAYELAASHEVTAASLAAAYQNTERQVKQAEAAFKLLPEAIPTYDHFTPAAWLIRNPSFLDDDSAEILATLDRAEKVFTTFNAML